MRGSWSLEKQFTYISMQVKFIFNSNSNPLFDPGVGDKNGPLPTFFPNHKFYFNETLHEDRCHLEILKM